MMPWKNEKWLCVDTETTSADPLTARIVELGLVRFQGGVLVERRGMLLNPECPIPAEASAIHGITDEDVADRPTLAQVADRFLAHVAAAPVVLAYNFTYDATILERDLGEPWVYALAGKVVLDPLVLVRTPAVGKFWAGKGRHRLGNVAAKLRLPAGTGHRATGDCETACRVLWHLREKLPDCGFEAMGYLAAERTKQEAEFAAWRARNPTEAA